jgi:hypothetical protein
MERPTAWPPRAGGHPSLGTSWDRALLAALALCLSVAACNGNVAVGGDRGPPAADGGGPLDDAPAPGPDTGPGRDTGSVPDRGDGPGPDAPPIPDALTGDAITPPPPPGDGLRVEGNRILGPDGTPFHGRGANLFDTRSCDACTYLDPDPTGLNRWADELLDTWGANLVRFDLMSFADDGGFRHQWMPITDDAGYLADVKNTVTHMTDKPGVYVMVTVFLDPRIKPENGDYDSEWPTPEVTPVYQALAEAFADDPKVLFGLTNEPHGTADHDAELADRYVAAIDAIRAVEQRVGGHQHIVVVQAPEGYARYLDYFIANPIQRDQVAYEVHVYNPASDLDALIRTPHQTLPILVGEHGPSMYSTTSDIMALWAICQELEIPHIAWSFHLRCPPSMLADSASDGCGLSASTGYDFPRSDWGNLFHDYLAMPW